MNLKKKYGNYELHPQMKITGYENEIWDEKKEIIEELKRAVQEKQKEKKTCILSFDLYPGVRKEEIMELANALQPDRIFDIEDCAKDEETLLREFNDYITDDRVFGIMCHKTIDTWFESEKLETMKKAIETECAEEKDTNGGLIVIVGTAAELLTEADLLVYCDLTRWEIQLRYRSGMPNWHSTNYNDPILTKYKRGFFIEWRLADRYKKERYEKFTYLLDTEKENAPVLTTGNAFRGALQQLARQPFRMEPYFDPGVWGGQWMKENFGLDASKENFAWSFDGVPEENSLNLEIGGKVLKVPAQDLVFYAPHELLGERVHGRFGAEFPIRFDLLDTMGGQNLSLQVHPLTEYIYEKLMKKPITIGDFSAVVTGLLLALNLPVSVPFWIPVVGGVFAILVVKMLFGGLGQNFMNPALAGRCFLLISFTSLMTNFNCDAYTGATPLASLKAGESVNVLNMILGRTAGTIGETSVIAIVLGACVLIVAGVIDLRVPGSYIASFAVFVLLFAALSGIAISPAYLSAQLAGGGLMLGAFFMATDYVTRPVTKKGQYIYGVILGFLTAIFRIFGASAEGVSYAIILGNLLVPLIERYTMPKAFGKGGERS